MVKLLGDVVGFEHPSNAVDVETRPVDGISHFLVSIREDHHCFL